jgi:hypothetical protein
MDTEVDIAIVGYGPVGRALAVTSVGDRMRNQRCQA